MKPRHIKLLRMNESDKRALESLLRLSASQLDHPWKIVEGLPADLEIFGIESQKDLHILEKSQAKAKAALTNQPLKSPSIDLVLNKPLHKSDLAEALNQIENKLTINAKEQSPIKHNEDISTNLDDGSLKQLFSSLVTKIKPAAHLPQLDFPKPIEVESNIKTISQPRLLAAWIGKLPDDFYHRISSLLGHAEALIQLKVKADFRLELLEVYRNELASLFITGGVTSRKQYSYPESENSKAITITNKLFSTLCNAYQQIIRSFYENGKTPEKSPTMHFCIIRACELLSWQLIYNYHHYYSTPKGIWHYLNQYYSYLEKADLLYEKALTKSLHTEQDYFSLFSQIILVTLVDPYRQDKFDTVRLYQLLTRFTDIITISCLTEHQLKTYNNFLLLGHYCVDTQSDSAPIAMYEASEQVRSLETSRLLDTQALLKYIETLLKDRNSVSFKTLIGSEIRLLNVLLKRLDTTQKTLLNDADELETDTEKQCSLVLGLTAILENLVNDSSQSSTEAELLLSDNEHLLIRIAAHPKQISLSIGDFVHLHRNNLVPLLVQVKWMQIQSDQSISVEFKILDGELISASWQNNENQGSDEQRPALLLNRGESARSFLITEKGVFSADRILYVTVNQKCHRIVINKLLNSNQNFDMFDFSLNRGSSNTLR